MDRDPLTVLPGAPGLLFRQVALLTFLCGIAAARFFLPGLLGLGLVFWFAWPRSRTVAAVFILLACFTIGYGYMGLRETGKPEEPQWLTAYFTEDEAWRNQAGPKPEAVRVTARVADVTRLPLGRTRILLDELRPVDAPLGEAAPGKFVWNLKTPEKLPLPGQAMEGEFTFARVRGSVNPGVFDLDRYWGDQDVWWRARNSGEDVIISGAPGVMEEARENLYRRFVAALPSRDGPLGEGAGILPALIFGDRSLLHPNDSDLVAKATLAHSLSLSGLHLGYAAALGFMLALGIGRVFPGLWLHIPRPVFAMLLCMPLAGAYLWLGSAPVSLQRSSMMLAFWALLLILRRPKVFLDGLLAAIALFALLDPTVLFDLSLQLSAICVAIIALTLPWLQRVVYQPKEAGPPRLATRLWRGFLSYLLLSFFIQVALLPLVARAFGSVGMLFPLNSLWLPVLGCVVMPLSFLGLLFSGLGLSSAAAWVLTLAAIPSQGLLEGLGWLDRTGFLWAPAALRPHWLTMIGYWVLCLALPLIWPGKEKAGGRGKALALAGAGLVMALAPMIWGLGLGWFGPDAVRLRMLDVGSGQAVCIEWGNGWTQGRALVDGGMASAVFDSGRSIVAPALTDNMPPRLDAVIYSHPDSDHLGGQVYILSAFDVGLFAGNGEQPSPQLAERLDRALVRKGLRPRTLAAGDVLELSPDLSFQALWPERSEGGFIDETSSNNASLVLRLVWKGKPLAVLCGDVEKAGLEAVVAAYDAAALRAPALVVPHHGSAGSLCEEFLDAVKPQVALVSCGYGNMWRFPAVPVREAFARRGIPLYSTSERGQIVLEWKRPDAEPEISLAAEEGE